MAAIKIASAATTNPLISLASGSAKEVSQSEERFPQRQSQDRVPVTDFPIFKKASDIQVWSLDSFT